MAASVAGFASILKEFYLGPIQDQLNNETLVCELMEKASVDWNGRQVIIPVHVGRNTAVGWVAEGGVLPGQAGAVGVPAVTPGAQPQQLYSNLTVTAEFLYGRFIITGPAMASAGKGGANSFVGWVDAEMNRLVTDIKNNCDRSGTSGGTCVGFVTHGNVMIPGAGTVDLLFDGDPVKLATLAAIGGAGLVDIIRLDTYATVRLGAAAITIAPGATPGTVNVGTGGGNLGFATDPAANSVPCAMVVTAVGTTALAALVPPQSFLTEPVGIYGNLGLPGTGVLGAELDWFGIDRTTVTAVGPPATGNNALQCGDGAAVPLSNLLSIVPVAAVPVRQAITMAQLQTAFDRISLASDETPDVILCSPLQRTRLAATLTNALAANVFDVKSKPETGDGGFKGFAFAGVPIKVSRHVDNGLMLLLNTKSWKMLELESGKFADSDGNVLSRVPGADAFEGFYKWYYNTVCLRPNSNGAITGLTL
jgi:hypothetical protein